MVRSESEEGSQEDLVKLPKLHGRPRGWKPHLLQVLHPLICRFLSLLSAFNLLSFRVCLVSSVGKSVVPQLGICVKGWIFGVWLLDLLVKVMDFKALGLRVPVKSLAWRMLLRAFVLGSAVMILCWVQMLSGSSPVKVIRGDYVGCDAQFVLNGIQPFSGRVFEPIWGASDGMVDVNATVEAAKKLVEMKMVDFSGKSLCVGEGSAPAVHALGELGFGNACGFPRAPIFSIKYRRLVKEVIYLAYADNSFDLVLSGNWNKLPVYPDLVREIERVLKPGGIGALLVDTTGTNPDGNALRYALPIAMLLRNSSVVHYGYVDGFALVVFRKKAISVTYFEHFQLPSDCQSVESSKSFVENLEPTTYTKPVEFEKKMVYLSKFIDLTSKRRPAYVEIGVGNNWSFNDSSRLLSSYPVNEKAFNVYLVDHNASTLLYSVKKAGVTFIYYPGLVGDETLPNQDGDDEGSSLYPDNEAFDLAIWFKEIVEHADFVILKISAGELELKFLADLFEAGTLCSVDELFLACPRYKGGKTVPRGECIDVLQNLRRGGIYAHQWWDD